MNKQLTQTEISDLMSPMPAVVPMSRKEKLLHWAGLIRKLPANGQFALFHLLEHWNTQQLAATKLFQCSDTAFALAAGDPTFNRMGLNAQSSMLDTMTFFSLTQAELHDFSCNCGGAITNKDMAGRIEAIANKGDGGGIVGRIVNGITRW